jgi:hypothetical protein
VLFARDDDLLAEAAQRQREGIPFRGIIDAHQPRRAQRPRGKRPT